MKRSPLGIVEATIYVRISHDPLKLMVGVENQIEACKKFCEERDWVVGQIFVDNDLSATAGVQRPEFEALLASRPQVIVVWHTDRLIRVNRDLERVIDLEVNVHAIQAGHLDLSTPAGRAVARTITAWATYEGEQKAARQRLAAEARAKRGEKWWPRRPFGFERDCSLQSEEANALRQAYMGLLAGSSLMRLARDLNAGGFKTNRDKAWTGTSLRAVLLNPRNAGIRTYWGEEVGTAAWDAIVPEDVYRRAVRILSDPDRSTGGGGRVPRYLLTNIAECGKCGGSVKVSIVYNLATKDRSYPVYSCRNKSCFTARVDWVDNYVMGWVKRQLSRPQSSTAWVPSGEDPAAELRKEAASLREKLEFLAEDYAVDRITRAAMLAGTDKARKRLAEVESELSKVDGDGPLRGLRGTPEEVEQRWKGLSLDRRRAAIAAVAPTIKLMPRGRGVRQMEAKHVRMPGDEETE